MFLNVFNGLRILSFNSFISSDSPRTGATASGVVDMNVSVTVIDTTPRGVQVILGSTDGPAFWLPRAAVIWAREPEPGECVSVRVPPWLIEKHGPLRQWRHQRSIAFQSPLDVGLDPTIASREGSLPMSDYPKDVGTGMLDKNREKTKPSQPDYFGRVEIEGRRYRISAWLKDSTKNAGQKYMSLSFRPDEQQQRSAEPQRQDRGGPTFDRDEQIPFAPQVL